MLKTMASCPQGYHWERRENPGGFQCARGGHGVTDTLLEEGKGGILAFFEEKGKKWEVEEDLEGVYYPCGKGDGSFFRATEKIRP